MPIFTKIIKHPNFTASGAYRRDAATTVRLLQGLHDHIQQLTPTAQQFVLVMLQLPTMTMRQLAMLVEVAGGSRKANRAFTRQPAYRELCEYRWLGQTWGEDSMATKALLNQLGFVPAQRPPADESLSDSVNRSDRPTVEKSSRKAWTVNPAALQALEQAKADEAAAAEEKAHKLSLPRAHIAHAVKKIAECAANLAKLDDRLGRTTSPDYRHNIFQMAYNMGRLSELKGFGRAVYDRFKPLVAAEDWAGIPDALQELMKE